METENRTWTEIKLRNPDAKLCQQLSQVMDQRNEKSATKAIEFLINNYEFQQNKIEQLLLTQRKYTERIDKLIDRAEAAEYKLLQIKNSYQQFNQLLESVEQLPDN